MNRREFIRLIGVLSATPIAGCERRRDRKLIPYLVPPEEGVVPGEPRWVRTTCTECPARCGVVVRIMDGRPVKLEGNPDHPDNAGALCVRGQASLERLYHPERIRQPLRRETSGNLVPVGWKEAFARVRKALQKAGEDGRESLYLSGRTTGRLSGLIDEFCGTMGVRRLPELELFHHGAIRKANEIAFGRPEIPAVNLDRADVVLTLGADLLGTFLNPVAHARQFAVARDRGLKWFHLEPHLTLTGIRANERWTVRPGSEAHVLSFLLGRLQGVQSLPAEVAAAVPTLSVEETARVTGLSTRRLSDLVGSLLQARSPLVVAGETATGHSNGLATALLASLLQWSLGIHGKTVDFSRAWNSSGLGTLRDAELLAGQLQQDRVGVLFLSRVPFVGSLPRLSRSLSRAGMTVALSEFVEPGLERCDLLLPLAHSLESWGDEEPRAGLRTVVQPTRKPLHDTLAEGDILLGLSGAGQTWQEVLLAGWDSPGSSWLDRGVHTWTPDSPPIALNPGAVAETLGLVKFEAPGDGGLVVTPSMRAFDGRSGRLGLLQEIPDPLSSISYGRWISVPEELGLRDGDVVEIAKGDARLHLPAKVQPGLPGRTTMLTLDALNGLDLAVDQGSGELHLYLDGLRPEPTGRRERLCVLSGSIEEARRRGVLPKEEETHHQPGSATLFPEHEHTHYRWALAVDLDKCTGCSACVAACYLENNVPVVGRQEHLHGREMSWLRIQPYRDRGGRIQFVPMMCQHCDMAPCETVCPVFATYHNPEGLNAQIYNRCVGTRYCANNCPYKARRFNWFAFPRPAPLDQMVNPDVSERPKGVMEKCTFCVQRIRRAKDRARDERRLVRDGDVAPACAQTCPTGAITFGSLLDAKSRVAGLARAPRAYRVFEELGTRPAVSYLKDEGGHGR